MLPGHRHDHDPEDTVTETTVTESTEQAASDLANRFWEGVLELEPFLGTYIGDDRYDDRLPDPSDEGQERKRDFYRSYQRELEQLDPGDLDVDLRTTLDVLDSACRRQLESIRWRLDRLEAVTHLFGPGNLLADMGSLQRADTPERVDKYVARLSAVPAYLGAIGEVIDGAVKDGQVSPALVVDRTIGQIERLLSMEPEQSPAMNALGESVSERDRERVTEALRARVLPAYQGYLEALRRSRPQARDSIGLLALPNGDEMYAAQILSYTTLPLAAKRVHDIGLEQLAKIQEERREIARRLGFSDVKSAISAHIESGKDTASSRQEMLDLIEDQVRRSWEAAPRYFGRLPKDNCLVKPIEEFRENDMPGAFYQPGTADGSRAGAYFVNTGHLDERYLHQTATTSFHEANPGHHFQLTLEIEFADRLPLRRFGGAFVGDAFVEGWGLYSERLAEEMGLFLDDYERLGMLEAQAFRACRLIVDTGIHALGWDRERSVLQMMESGSSRADCEIEVDRYISWPGQALAYMIGQLEIQRWRSEAAARDGSSFSLKDFHDRLLSLGSLPLSALERELKV
jgi:uncharacterized protein (DUF885 family)